MDMSGPELNLKILRINTAGTPVEWLSWQEAVCLHAREMVTWTYGEEVMEVRGGHSRITGNRTLVQLNSIIACRGKVHISGRRAPPLTIEPCSVAIRIFVCTAVRGLRKET